MRFFGGKASTWSVVAMCVCVFLLCTVLPLVLAVQGEGRMNSTNLRQMLKKRCLVACEPQLKSEAVCDSFCEFVDHIIDDHGQQMLDMWNHLEHHENYETALDWSMEETVRYRRQTYSEDMHLLGEFFMNSVRDYHKRLERMEEL